MSRTVGTNGGTWHGESNDEVKYWLDNREFKGTRKRFRYQNKQRPDQHGCWTLLEYGSESISENDVICKLKISDRGLKKSRQRKSIASSKVIQRNINIDAVINSGPTTAQSATGPPASVSNLMARLKLDGDSQTSCWGSLVQLQACSGEIILFFLNGEAQLGRSCCQALRTIGEHCWPNMIETLGFTPEEGHILEGYCDKAADPATPSPPPPSVMPAKVVPKQT